VNLKQKFRLQYYRLRRFAKKYTQGANTVANLKKIIISKNASGKITLDDYVICNAELYSFFDRGVIRVGRCSYLGENTRIWALTQVFVGDRVLISHDCFICDNLTHPLDARVRHQQYMAKHGFEFPVSIDLAGAPITIENDVWIAAGVTILKGVTVGAGSIVAAASVVTKDVPPNVIVAGNPARIIRKLEVNSDLGVIDGVA
jgi:acetyltransferase-like isoleucine patch superfamily enzyme